MIMTVEQRKAAAQKIAEQRHLGQPDSNKKCPHEVIDRKVAEFLANGGKITVIPTNEPDNRYYRPCGHGNGFATGSGDI